MTEKECNNWRFYLLNIIIPMAGLGSRFPERIYQTCKPLIPINGMPMIVHTINSLNLSGNYIFILKQDKYTEELTSVLKNTSVDCKIIILSESTSGPAETCLAARQYLSDEEELVIANSDQIMWWNSELFVNSTKANSIDGVIVTFNSKSPLNSYAKINNFGYVVEIKEKEVISDLALNGIHYWKKAKDFFWSTETMIKAADKSMGEYYIGPAFNYLLAKGFRLGIHHIPGFQHNPVGVPDDLQTYKEKLWKYTELKNFLEDGL